MRLLRLVVAISTALFSLSTIRAEPQRPIHAAGYVIADAQTGPLPALPATATPPDLSGGAEPGKVWALLTVPSTTRSAPFSTELAEIGAAVDALRAADQPVVIALDAQRATAPGDEGRRVWLEWLRALTRAMQGKVLWYLVSGLDPQPGQPDSARQTTLEIKAAAVTIRAEDAAAGFALALPSASALADVATVFRTAGDLEPYVDGLCVTVVETEPVEAVVTQTRALLNEVDPGASLWLRGSVSAPDAKQLEDQVLRRAAELIGLRVDLAWFDLPVSAGTTNGRPPVAGRALRVFTRALHTGLANSTRENAGIEPAAGQADLVHWSRFFDDKNFQEAIVYWSPASELPEGSRVRFEFDTVLRRNFKVLDPVTGNPGAVQSTKLGGQRAALDLPLAKRPRLLTFTLDKSSEGFGEQPEEREIEAVRKTTADEVIAFHQRFRAFQDDRLTSHHSASTMKIRFSGGGGTGSFEVALVGDYFWDRVTGAEWTIREKFVEGVKLKWDKVPELPFIGVERAAQPPLDLKLDKRYRYELLADDTIEGYKCWQLRFEPLDETLSLQKGRAYIDQASGAMVRVAFVQTNTAAPVVSNQETQEFRPVTGPDGAPFWVLTHSEGQQLYSVGGINIVVLREALFGPPAINAPDFVAQRDQAYQSNLQMLRDTDKGMQWLSKDKSGARVVNPGDTTHVLLGAGLIKSGNFFAPVGVLNYTDLNAFGKNKILNVALSGVVNNVFLSDPKLFGTRIDAGAYLTVSAIPNEDREYRQADELEARRVTRFTQNGGINLGYPLFEFVKVTGSLSWNYNRYSRAKETKNFLPPADHLATTYALQTSFDRAGWGIKVATDLTNRSSWTSWGPDGPERAQGPEIARQKTYSTYSIEAGKTFFLPYFQKLTVSSLYEAGRDLDRFSAFGFGLFGGSRLAGFGDAGIRFDRGLISGISYGFALNNAVKLTLAVDHARVHDEDLNSELTKGDISKHTGVSLSAGLPGPWQTLVQLNAGYALASDLKAAEGGTEFYIAVLKLFDK